MVEWKGYVEKIVYRNEENGYTVLHLSNPGEEEICCVGNFTFVSQGQYLVIQGREVLHKDYGMQVQMESYEERQPENAAAIERYLGSGAIKGIGAALAARIVRRFGEETFRILQEEPERLAEVKGISMKMARSVSAQFHEKQELRQAMLFLQDYGLSMNMAVKIYRRYGEEMYEVMRQNPYRLAEDIPGVGFKIADSIALRAGFFPDSDFRIQAGIVYCLQQSGSQGHCYLPEKELIDQAAQMLALETEQVERQVERLSMDKQVVVRERGGQRCLYSSALYYMELNCARMLLDLNQSFPVEEEALADKLKQIEAREGICLDSQQRCAVYQAVCNGVMIIMGGPGTGKTTTINTITQIFEEEGMDILLAAPTGRAAKRMAEATGYEAQTIHRMLELNGSPEDDRSGMHFERNEQQPLEADVVIVDEMSMVDIYLLNALLRALVPGTRLIMVGDVNQLPSVGPGNVLKDMICAHFCNVVKLNKIFRQAAESEIILNAHRINRGEPIALDNKSKDFFHLERKNSQDIINVVIQLVMQKLPPYVGASSYDIQVLSPMRKGELGVENLNTILQRYINPVNPEKKEREFHGVLFREGDKIMQIKNDYQLKWRKENRFGDVYEEGSGVFNGDCGVIREISVLTESVLVEFDENRLAEYQFTDMDELELAYAITIHKSQGSEYPAVVIPVLNGPKLLFNRNLLYTGVTRAKKCVTMVGSSAMISRMIQNVNEQKRYSSLEQCIREMEGED